MSTTSQPATISRYTCSAGTLSGSSCLTTNTYGATIARYSCNAGDTLSGTTCTRTVVSTYAGTPVYNCNAGDSRSGSTCTHTGTNTYPATVIGYRCNAGDTLGGSTCTRTTSVAATPVYTCSVGMLSGNQCISGTKQTRTAYVYLAGKQIAEVAEGVIQYVHTDALGSPVAHSNAGGTVLNRSRYEAYGRVAQGTKPSPATSVVGFTGHVQDAETDLVYMQQRYYDPLAGRFLSVDPVVADSDTGDLFNRYVYAHNNPYRYTDPDGRNPAALVGALVEVGFQTYTGELRTAMSDALGGNFGGLAVSAAKIGIAAASGGVSSIMAAKGAALAVMGAEAAATRLGVTATAAATKSAEVAGVAGAQAANGVGAKVATNAVEGKQLAEGTGTAAAVGATVGTAGRYAGNAVAHALNGSVGATAGNAARVGSQIITGGAKKEASCSASNGSPC